MRPFRALIRKQIVESRYTLLFSAAALFCLGWLFVYVTSLNEAEILHQLDSGEGGGRIQFLRYLGVAKQPESIELLLVSWNHPLIVLLISFWPISRGSAAVAAEGERGTMDLILSRPVARWAYLAAQVFVAILGLAILPGALLAGTLFGVRYNILHDPPGASALIRPALNLAALGLPMYGYTLLVSAARPRPLAAHLGRVRTDLGRLHRLFRFGDPRAGRHLVEALAGTHFDFQGVQPRRAGGQPRVVLFPCRAPRRHRRRRHHPGFRGIRLSRPAHQWLNSD